MKKFLVAFGILISFAISYIQLQAKPVELIPPPTRTGDERTSFEQPTAVSGANFHIHLPIIIKPTKYANDLNIQDRRSVVDYYITTYHNSIPNIGWDGSQEECNAGSTSSTYKEAIAQRINYYRAMAGVPAEITMRDIYNQKAQEAALIMSANDNLSHSPPANWLCYNENGAEAAGSSNLYLGRYGLSAIDGYIKDPGAGNYAVGHRRWILYPWTKTMGTGDIPTTQGYRSSNALWVFGDRYNTEPSTRDPFVAWPPNGYVPYQVVYARWSFSYPDADFSQAEVSMTQNESLVPVTQEPVVDGFGDETIVWRPMDMGNSESWPQPSKDTSYEITIRNIIINGLPETISYTVTVIDPTWSASVFGATGDG